MPDSRFPRPKSPGEYCLPYIEWVCSESCDECGGDGVRADGYYCERDIEGWLVLHRDLEVAA